jgi:hypothetical protein
VAAARRKIDRLFDQLIPFFAVDAPGQLLQRVAEIVAGAAKLILVGGLALLDGEDQAHGLDCL